MKYFWKVWLWKNGKKETDLTEYLTVPIYLEPHLDEILGTGEIILDRVPVAEKGKCFKPKTKFRLERYLSSDFSDTPKTYDFVVDSDQLEVYPGCPELCCHRIMLIEPSVVAQGMHVDNISLTRELNDIDLNYKTITSSTETCYLTKNEINGSGYERPNLEFGTTGRNGTGWYNSLGDASHRFTNSFRYIWSNTSYLEKLLKNLNGAVENEISFTVPTLTCQFLEGVVPVNLFECPIRTTVDRTTMIDGKIVPNSSIIVASHFYNPVGIRSSIPYVMYNENGKVGLDYIVSENYEDRDIGGGSTQAKAVFFPKNRLGKFPALINTNDTSHTSKTLSFKTTVLSQAELDEKKSYLYNIYCCISPYETGSLVSNFTKTSSLDYNAGFWVVVGTINQWARYSVIDNSISKFSIESASLSATFEAKDVSVVSEYNPFLVKPKKYSCFDLIRKALLTVDTKIIDNTQYGLDPKYDENYNDIGIKFPIVIAPEWIIKLKETQLHETVFENKNLWEILLQVGYYLHAIPKLTFSNDGSDTFVLSFRQLGDDVKKTNDNVKISIFNSQNLSEYFTQLDSYVTNIFSPQNDITETLVCKTSDSSYLVSNDTAEIHTKLNITEIVAFDITYKDKTLSALDYIFEKSVYNTLTAKTGIYPGKWAALYYELGNNKILGLNYAPPSANNDELVSLKQIVAKLFGLSKSQVSNLKFNELKFKIKYKTQDSLRVSQFKPNLHSFMKNSEYENYPHHEQFFGQQDKIVDSERFSANLWGRLVRTANDIYQCNEYSTIGNEKEVGDLVIICNSPYYVMNLENEYYNDIILQKVTYSKNYNQISQVVTIPSEPRFYEISERSMIRREVRLFDFLMLSTHVPSATEIRQPNYFSPTYWKDFFMDLIFNYDIEQSDHGLIPNYAYTEFRADSFRAHIRDDGRIIKPNQLYPSSETETVDGVVNQKQSSYKRAVIVPLLHYPLKNAIVFEWDMDDNFKAGDSIDISTNDGSSDSDYYELLPVRYCDVMGKADLFNFRLFYKNSFTIEQARRLPFAENTDFIPTEEDSSFYLPNNLSIGLDKDNREAISFNYQINLLTSDNDTLNPFIIYPNAFGQKSGGLNICLLNHEVSMFSDTVDMSYSNIVEDNVEWYVTECNEGIRLVIRDPHVDLSRVKSIVLYEVGQTTLVTSRYAVIARNVANCADEEKLNDWYLFPVFSAKN